MITAEEFAVFQNAGYMGLYGGMTVDDIHRKKNLEVGQKILDYMGSTELIANLFRISQTEEKLRKDRISNSDSASAVHYKVGSEVREAIEKIGGTMPGRPSHSGKEHCTTGKRTASAIKTASAGWTINAG